MAALTSAVPVSAADDNRNITVLTEIAPAYIVIIPTNTMVYFNVIDIDFGAVELTKAQLEPKKCVRVTLITENKLENESNAEKVLPYTVRSGETAFASAKYMAVGEKTALTIHIEQDDLNKTDTSSSRNDSSTSSTTTSSNNGGRSNSNDNKT